MKERRWRVAVVTSHPIQYQAPWFRALAAVVDLEVYFCHRQDPRGQAAAGFDLLFDWDVPLLDGYRYHWLDNVAAEPNVSSYSGCDTPDVGDILARGRFDACIVSGWYLKSYIQAIRGCWKHHVKVFVRGDSQLGTKRSRVKSAAKWLPYRVLLNRVDGHLYVGQANRAYLKHYGVPDRKLFFVPHFVDNGFFGGGAERARKQGASQAVRREFGIPDNAVVALFVGRFVSQKRPLDFVNAVAAAHKVDPSIYGLMVGSGPLMKEVKAQVAQIDAPIRLTGFRNQTELPACYAAADMLVLPSDGRETWGLVVNEAMACGVPAIVSDAVGCAPDLVQASETGYSFPVGDADALANRLVQLRADLSARAAEIRDSVLSRIAAYDSQAAVDGVLAALAAVHGGAGADESGSGKQAYERRANRQSLKPEAAAVNATDGFLRGANRLAARAGFARTASDRPGCPRHQDR